MNRETPSQGRIGLIQAGRPGLDFMEKLDRAPDLNIGIDRSGLLYKQVSSDKS
jgi:hypothetical protein